MAFDCSHTSIYRIASIYIYIYIFQSDLMLINRIVTRNFQGVLPLDNFEEVCKRNFSWNFTENSPTIFPSEWSQKFSKGTYLSKVLGKLVHPLSIEFLLENFPDTSSHWKIEVSLGKFPKVFFSLKNRNF